MRVGLPLLLWLGCGSPSAVPPPFDAPTPTYSLPEGTLVRLNYVDRLSQAVTCHDSTSSSWTWRYSRQTMRSEGSNPYPGGLELQFTTDHFYHGKVPSGEAYITMYEGLLYSYSEWRLIDRTSGATCLDYWAGSVTVLMTP